MKHVFAIKIEGDTLKVLDKRWDSAIQMKAELPNGEYLLGSSFTVNDETRAAEKGALTEAEQQAAELKKQQIESLNKQAKELQDRLAALTGGAV